MTTAPLDMTSPEVELKVLRWLASQRTLGWIAQQLGCMPVEARDIAKKYAALREDGFVDSVKCAHAAVELHQRLAPPAAAGQPAPSSPGRGSEAAAPRTTPQPAPAALSDGTMLLEIPVARLKPDPDNPREDLGDIDELAASIHTAGLLQPPIVRRAGAEYFIVGGHRRVAAVRVLGWKLCPVVVRREMRPDEVLAAMLIENGQRKDLDFIEEARGLARLKAQLNCTDAELARRSRRTQTHVAGRLHLLALPVEEQEALRDGELSLQEATHKARLASGRLPSSTPRGTSYLSPAHSLAPAAKARCQRLRHSRGRGRGVGGVACGECWESVIRADERTHLHAVSVNKGECVICGVPSTTRKDRSA